MTTDPDGSVLGEELSTAVVLFHEAIGRRLGLSATDHKALGIVRRSGPLTAGRLSQLTGLTPGAVTGLVDRLQRAGYVRRRPDPADRRRILIEAVPGRHGDPAAVFARLRAAMGEVNARYDERELMVIDDWVTRTIDVLRTETKRLSAAEEPPGTATGAAPVTGGPPGTGGPSRTPEDSPPEGGGAASATEDSPSDPQGPPTAAPGPRPASGVRPAGDDPRTGRDPAR